MNKRILSCIMAVCLMGSGCFIPEMPFRASAETYTYESLKYKFSEDGTVEITGCDKSAESVVIPEQIDGIKVTGIGNWSFTDCKNLSSIEISDNISGIGYYAFANCESLKEIKIPESVMYINIGAFSGCKNLTEITLSGSITAIENSTFSGCTGLKEIAVPDGVRNIGSSTFSGCTGLETITIPDSVENISISALNGCKDLKSVEVSGNNAYYSSMDGILFNKDKSEIIRYCMGLSDTVYEIPESVKTIGSYAFSGCTDLEEIKIPESVESIGAGAFSDCKNITEMTIPENVGNIGEKAFKNCINLKSVNIPECIRNINPEVFYNCVNLKEIKLPECLETIGAGAFQSCRTLKKLDIPESLEIIGYYAFGDCIGIKKIEIPENVKVVDYSFVGCSISIITVLSTECEIKGSVYRNSNYLGRVKMYGYEDAKAMEYARIYDCSFYTLSKITNKVLGDLDGDNELRYVDFKILKSYLLDGTDTEIVEWRNADFNGDGVLDIFDLCLMNDKIVREGW